MMNIIKTAIITIIISFISGLLLDYYRNLAPKILCTIKDNIISKYNKKIYTYIITISNISNKTIHELTLNIQSPQTNLKIVNSKITRGLKFTSSTKGNNLDISIPFLSKDDTFSITVCAENEVTMFDKPFIVIRSPEKFKQVDSLKSSGILSSFSDKPKAAVNDAKNGFTKIMDNPLKTAKITPKKNKKKLYKNKKISKNKKILIVITSIILLVCIGFLGKYCYKVVTNMITTNTENETPSKSTDTKDSSKNTDKKDVNKSDKEATPNINSNSLPKKENKNVTPNKSTENTNKDINSNSVDEATDKNTSSSSKNTNSNLPNESTSSNSSNEQTGKNTDSNISNENKDSVPSDEQTNKNTDSTSSDGDTTQNISN